MQISSVIFQTPAQIRTHCLHALSFIKSRLENFPVELMNEFEQNQDFTRIAYENFLRIPSASSAICLLTSSLMCFWSFELIHELCNEIYELEVLFNQNEGVLRQLDNNNQPWTDLSALLYRSDSFISRLPILMLEDLYNLIQTNPFLSVELDGLLSQEPDVVQEWWVVWNCTAPNFNQAIQFASRTNPSNRILVEEHNVF